MSKVQAVILAGGQGSRMRPYTAVLPKPLLPLGEMPIAEIVIRQLKHYGIKDIAISTGHLAGLIETYFGDGSRWGVNIQYVLEDKPLGTAGALKLVKNLETNFLVINGDVLTDINFRDFFKFHKAKKGAATIAVKERIIKNDFGVIEMSQAGQLQDYIEKPQHKSYVSMGVNILNKKVRDYIEKDESIGMPELMLRIKERGQKVFCYTKTKKWLDLGRHDDFEAAQQVFKKDKKKFLLS